MSHCYLWPVPSWPQGTEKSLSSLCGWLFILQSDPSMSQCSSSASSSPHSPFQRWFNTHAALQIYWQCLFFFRMLTIGCYHIVWAHIFDETTLQFNYKVISHLMPWSEKNLNKGKIWLSPFPCLSLFSYYFCSCVSHGVSLCANTANPHKAFNF